MGLAASVIREATPDDWLAIADLHAASWRAAYRGMLSDAYLDGPMLAERRVIWRRRFEPPVSPDQLTVLAEAAGAPAGGDAPLGFCCVLAGHDPAWGSLIDNLHVRPGLTRSRLGRALLRAAAIRVPARHAATAIHLTVLEDNARAKAAYERWGGELVERLEKLEPDGERVRIRRYSWRDPATLVACLDSLP